KRIYSVAFFGISGSAPKHIVATKWPTFQQRRPNGYFPIRTTVKHGCGSLMVCGCMNAEGAGYLTKIEACLDAELCCHILEDKLVQIVAYYWLDTETMLLQHENDPKCTARITTKWLEDHGISVL